MRRLTGFLFFIWAIALLFSLPETFSFFFWRRQIILLTGILALGYMSAAMVLAIRPAWLEKWLNGLDKMYRLHKHLGIGAFVMLSLHWLAFKAGKWLTQAGVLQRPHRGPPEGINWHAIANDIGEYAFYAFVIFAVVSLAKKMFNYKKFMLLHKLAGVIFIAGALHTVLSLNWGANQAIYSFAAVLLCAVGGYCAWLSLSGKIGRNRKVRGNVTQTRTLADNTLNFHLQLDGDIHYRPGQFIYLDLLDGESPHPFTVVNYDAGTRTLELAVKALGDYTSTLLKTLQPGQPAEVEGGYGRFLLVNDTHQVWIGAGIGITPFIAWLEALAAGRHSAKHIEKIVFFYCAASPREAFFLQRLQQLTSKITCIDFQVLLAERGELLTPEAIVERMGNRRDYSVSFCGPAPFAQTLKKGLTATGWDERRFHNELFSMR